MLSYDEVCELYKKYCIRYDYKTKEALIVERANLSNEAPEDLTSKIKAAIYLWTTIEEMSDIYHYRKQEDDIATFKEKTTFELQQAILDVSNKGNYELSCGGFRIS